MIADTLLCALHAKVSCPFSFSPSLLDRGGGGGGFDRLTFLDVAVLVEDHDPA